MKTYIRNDSEWDVHKKSAEGQINYAIFEFGYLCACIASILHGWAEFQSMNWLTLDLPGQTKAVFPIAVGIYLGIGFYVSAGTGPPYKGV